MSDEKKLDQLRKSIDTIDSQLLELINQRADCAKKVAKVKESSGDTVYFRPEREANVLRNVMEKNNGPLGGEEVARLFREIMSACLALEQPIKVAFLGPEGTFTQQAAIKHFGNSAVTVSMNAIDEVFREVDAGSANYGVVPVENSTEGIINNTLDAFLASSLKICGEVELRIHHNFLVSQNTHKDKITRVYSHSQSLAQCRQWLDAHYPKAERIAVSSNAEAAKRIKGEWNSAAIAGDMAAELYNLEKLSEKIEDRPDNSTRFLIIGREKILQSGEDKTSIIIAAKNEPGALYNLLAPFYKEGVDLTRVETRPSREGKWTYVFFVDFRGHKDDPVIVKVLAEVSQIVMNLRVLGSYPKAVL
jgi:chorismate mutase / prephenate dehydratase